GRAAPSMRPSSGARREGRAAAATRQRVGIVVRSAQGEYLSLTGNQVGALLTDYVISARTEKGLMPEKPAVVTTIVSTRMPFELCRRNHVDVFEVLTGFKFIGEKIKEFEDTGSHSFVFGFEESYGYLSGTYARDKDAVVGSMLIAEMAAWYRLKGMTLFDAINALYRKYGYYGERTVSVNMQGLDAFARMQATMQRLRAEAPREAAGVAVTAVRDYLSGERTVLATGVKEPAGLPVSDVLFYEFEDGNSVVVRPSGTEPKVKLYVLCKGENDAAVEASLDKYVAAFRKLME
ncbi:MAG: phospho-sugar mutase, partial [Clostridia bacterium]|nr:phospho-sugar mutase [Clostridia bacterium]